MHSFGALTRKGFSVSRPLGEQLFRGANVADALQQLVEVIPAAGILKPLVVHDEALDQILPEVGVAHWRNWVPRGERTR